MTNSPLHEMPACSECRRRKLRCSRELPTCKECRRLGAECHYAARENKPGMKPGAVENLNRRVDHLENLILQVKRQIEPITRDYEKSGRLTFLGPGEGGVRTASDLLENFEKELKRFKNSTSTAGSSRLDAPHKEKDHPASSSSATQSENYGPEFGETISESGRKRRRLDSRVDLTWGERVLPFSTQNPTSPLTSDDLLSLVIEAYFVEVHQWIPMVHQGRFRRRLSSERNESALEVLLHAMVVAAIKFVDFGNTYDEREILSMIKRSRDFVVLNAMNSLGVENLQALTIVAFDDIGNDDAEKAWSIVGSLTRTVEYLQLSIESENTEEMAMLQPLPLLPYAKDWVEVEEQRRIFWNIFNLDRFCSIVTGWNTSLTSDDVRRCLPVDGILWRKEQQASTPYFGIWDRSAGKIGNSIASLPSQYSPPGRTPNGLRDSLTDNLNNGGSKTAPDVSTIGAFAYSIEATESMSRVTTYFLQQKVNLKNQKQIEKWLNRFKELDLRLVHWKMFLPQNWKDTKIVSKRSSEYIMDPNLTIAHLTHNASMILLHQLIAYPPATWGWASRLPSRYSADTCQAAAVEIATIAQNYLASRTTTKVISVQFIFCLYVAARSLLIHWRYYSRAAPLPEFDSLVQSLDEISVRWQGHLQSQAIGRTNLAGNYAKQLRTLRDKCNQHETFRVDVLGYVCATGNAHRKIIGHSRVESSEGSEGGNNNSEGKEKQVVYEKPPGLSAYSPSSGMLPPIHQILPRPKSRVEQLSPVVASNAQGSPHFFGQLPISRGSGNPPSNYYPASQSDVQAGSVSSNAIVDEYDLNSISQMFYDPQYVDMDRVINFDDGMFNGNMGNDLMN